MSSSPLASSPLSSQTQQAESQEPTQQKLDLASLPPIYVSSTHMELDDLHELEDRLAETGAMLTYDIHEARIVLSKVERKRRAQFDLQSNGLWTKEVESKLDVPSQTIPERPAKRQRILEKVGKDEAKAIVIDESSTESEAEEDARSKPEPASAESPSVGQIVESQPASSPRNDLSHLFVGNTVRVLKIDWFEESVKAGKVLPIEQYLTFAGNRIPRPDNTQTPPSTPSRETEIKMNARSSPKSPSVRSIMERAKADAPSNQSSPARFRPHGPRKFGQSAAPAMGATFDRGANDTQYAHLLHQTTSEYELGSSSDLPEMPDWVKQQIKYSCQRNTPATSPNDPFLALLKEIKLARLLTNDEIGVRAYSTSIASIAAYPYKLSSPREILALPGCDVKIANLFVEYANTGVLRAATDASTNTDLQILRLFYNIWGVGATTAREYYYDRGWRELDDIVEFGWSTLSRVQQIGVKYYDEFLTPIPHAEVETIASIIHAHAVKVRDERVQSLLVGGYRRGKAASGDVDIVVSHPDESKTLNIVTDIVASLEEEGWITHTLLLSLTSTQRGQQTLPFKGSNGSSRGSGFDTLDKALVVWQDPEWSTKQADLAANPKAKNPNVHRRVDIIISPWRTVGCAVAGWSSGTTFQRDLRRYVKNVKGWKFDSSGIRDRSSGLVVDVERYEGDEKYRAKTMEEAERRVFEGLDLEWREPWERCTG